MTDFTPGPWGFAPIDPELTQGYRYAINQNGGGWWIAKVSGGKHFAAAEANARLIAAAPDLLAALQDLVSVCDEGDGPALFDARDAIAKATGGGA